MLLHIPDVLDAATLQQVQQLLADAPWADGRRTAGSQAQQAKHNQQLPTQSEASLAARSLVLQALDRNALFFSAALPAKVFPPQFNRYGGETNHYGNHIDGALMHVASPGPLQGQRVRSDVSCTLFLSDPDSYEGGDLVIEDTFGPRRVKLPAGHMVLYPSTSVHRVEPVTRGHRVASFFWVQSLVRSDEQRRLLFDLDMDLMRLRSAHNGAAPAAPGGPGASAQHASQHATQHALVGLSGTYHNLLRMWAEA